MKPVGHADLKEITHVEGDREQIEAEAAVRWGAKLRGDLSVSTTHTQSIIDGLTRDSQTGIARRARSDALNSLLIDILRRGPLGLEDVLDRLGARVGLGVIEVVSPYEVAWSNGLGKQRSTTTHALRRRIQRLNRQIKRDASR